ncbi:hypothetical protein [Nitrosomonas halophila]|uniref:Uncharacterized protein n=1 Tax=Nitrosomonas halophila TaxID=44576 RepID=A0A1H3NF88_9PROT|nr:hypothetical protein [Nitrosomonas halophila]SDY87330.1 hypothetical protein SAMN05421881_10729 [Nitrosomonas halophila]
MKKKFMSFGAGFAAIGLMLSMASHADPMVVIKGKAVFLAADDQLTILPDAPDEPLACTFEDGVFVPGASAAISVPVPGAIDVKVIGGDAYVATSSLENNAALTGYTKFDVNACLPETPFIPHRARANLTSGELVIPCVEVDGNDYNLVMKQRGNSMNWAVDFVAGGCY